MWKFEENRKNKDEKGGSPMEKKLIVIRNTLWEMNIPPTYLGTHYLAYAELLVLEDPDRLTMVTKWLYPEIAAYYHTSWKAVERNIRTVIALCWDQDKGEALQRRLGLTLEVRPCPTGMIQMLARYLLQQPEEFWQCASNGFPPDQGKHRRSPRAKGPVTADAAHPG
jgi:two-component system response regulator (stage 0 sporulation protein A)